MILTLIHMTDIHLNNSQNTLFDKAPFLWKAIKSELRNTDKVVCCVSGDIAQSGNENEYFNFAIPIFDNIKEEIKKELNLDCDFLFIPGNHDCDFSDQNAGDTRKILLSNIGDSGIKLNSHTIEAIKVQRKFDDFKELFHSSWVNCKLIFKDQLAEKVSLTLDGKEIIFNLYNSSWISTLHEEPGHMFYPAEDYKEMKKQIGDINISLVHHPDHWLQPDNRREFKDLLESTSDFILSGHEHMSTHTIATDWEDKRIQYIEGGVLQELSDSNKSSYNIIHLDIEKRKQRIVEYTWSGAIYDISKDTDWRDFKSESSIKNQSITSLELKREFQNYINDLGIPLTHPRVTYPTLNDFYIFPNVKEILYQTKHNEIIKFQEIQDIFDDIQPQSHVVFSGDRESGKTSLAKIIFQNYFSRGRYPLLLEGSDIKPSNLNSIPKLIEEGIKKIYGAERGPRYLQLDKNERILIIDNWQNTRLNDKYKSKFLLEASRWFDNVFFLTESLSNIGDFIHLVSDDEQSYDIRQFEIQELGYEKREELIDNWIKLGQERILEESDFIRLKDKYEKAINSIIGQNYIPTYPFYILIILQTLESGNSHNLDRSTNGYYYEVLIKQSLGRIQMSNEETDKMYNYMTELAFKFFNEHISYLDESGWRTFHEYYRVEYALTPQQFTFEEYQNKLIASKILESEYSGYRFSYPYIYYFFVAQYLAKYIQEDESKSIVTLMCNNLHKYDHAHILMFLTHLSKDRFIISKIIESAKVIFEDVPILKLEDDIGVVNELMDNIPQLVIGNIDVVENRRNENKRKDEIDRLPNYEQDEIELTNTEQANDEENGIEMIAQLNKSFKMIEIIGQILKNYYGSTKAREKIELCNEVFEVALRTNNTVMISLNEDKDTLIRFLSSIIRERGFDSDESHIESVSKRILYTMAKAVTLSTIAKVSISVGTKNLDETFQSVQELMPVTSVKLINAAIKLEHYEKFPSAEISTLYKELKENNMAKDILQNLVGKYLYMFQTDFKERQAICASVNIKYNPTIFLNTPYNKKGIKK